MIKLLPIGVLLGICIAMPGHPAFASEEHNIPRSWCSQELGDSKWDFEIYIGDRNSRNNGVMVVTASLDQDDAQAVYCDSLENTYIDAKTSRSAWWFRNAVWIVRDSELERLLADGCWIEEFEVDNIAHESWPSGINENVLEFICKNSYHIESEGFHFFIFSNVGDDITIVPTRINCDYSVSAMSAPAIPYSRSLLTDIQVDETHLTELRFDLRGNYITNLHINTDAELIWLPHSTAEKFNLEKDRWSNIDWRYSH